MKPHQSLLALLLGVLAFSPAIAQPPVPPPVPNPQAPVLAPVVPLGMQRGTKLELTLTGTNLADPTGVWTSFPAKVTIPTDMNNGKDNAKLRVVLETAPDAQIGPHTIRVATSRGMSNFRPFCIDDLPQVLETPATSRNRSTPQVVPVPCVVVGRADAETSAYYKFTVKANQRLSFEIVGRRLGSAFDPQFTLLDAKTGSDLPGGFSNDSPGLQTDPRLTYAFKEAGDYLIEVRDVTHRGGPDFHYRLRIGDFPCATTPYPLMVQRGVKTIVGFAGPSVDGVGPVEVTAPADTTVQTLWLAPKSNSGLHGWPVALAIGSVPEVAEQEPNNEVGKATRLPSIPSGVSGRFLQKGDIDHYVFAAKKGQRYVIEAQTVELNSPTDVYLVLKDAKGTQLAASNPDVAPRIDYTAPADADLILVVEHLHYWGGPEETYHLTVSPYEQGFDIAAGLERWDAPQSGSFSIPILLTRRDYAGPIDVTVLGDGLSGQVTIPAGPPKPGAPAGTLTIKVADNAPVGPLTFFVVGKAAINMKPVERLATFRLVVNQFMATLPYPPPQFETRFALAVRVRPPFILATKFDAVNVEPGKPITATVTASRSPGFGEEIVLTAAGFPATIKPVLKNIAKGQNEVKVEFAVAPTAAAGTFPVTFTGKAKVGMVEVIGAAPPASLVVFVIPFELKVEPVPVKLQQAGKVKIKVTAARKNYPGPIVLEVRNLPVGVTAPKTTLPANAAFVEIELTAAATAVVGDRADVNVVGVGAAPGNFTRPSPNFSLGVAKK